MQHTVFANKPAPSTGAEYANSDRRTGFAHVSRSACHGRAASPAFNGCVRYARSDSHYARASSAGLFSRRPVRGSRLRPRKDASIIRPYAIMAGVLVVVAVVVAVCATVGRGCVDAGTASGPGAIAGSISTPVGEWSQGQVPRLYQTDPAWAGAPYAGSTVEEAGCGPTCLAMVYVSITGKKDYDPASLCAFSEREGYVSGGETSWLLMSEGARKLGLMSEEVPADASSVTAGGLAEAGQLDHLQRGSRRLHHHGPFHRACRTGRRRPPRRARSQQRRTYRADVGPARPSFANAATSAGRSPQPRGRCLSGPPWGRCAAARAGCGVSSSGSQAWNRPVPPSTLSSSMKLCRNHASAPATHSARERRSLSACNSRTTVVRNS